MKVRIFASKSIMSFSTWYGKRAGGGTETSSAVFSKFCVCFLHRTVYSYESVLQARCEYLYGDSGTTRTARSRVPCQEDWSWSPSGASPSVVAPLPFDASGVRSSV